MARRRKNARDVDGILVLNKELDMSSNQALQRVRWQYSAAKAGHTGALDPKATGVLPVCFGEATKFSQYLLDSDKRYRATVKLGVRTETQDTEGEVVSEKSAAHLKLKHIEAILDDFRGDIEQVPSMYSAIKHQGQPLYKYARKGIEIERKPRPITIYELEVMSFESGEHPILVIEVACSKGTYIRSLADDIGLALGVGGHLIGLHRIAAGPFHEDDSVTLTALIDERGEEGPEKLDHWLLPVEDAVDHLPEVVVDEHSGLFLKQGQPVLEPSALKVADAGELVRLVVEYKEYDEFIGLGEILSDGRLAPKKLLATN